MRGQAWLLSAKLAWSRHWIKAATALALIECVAGSVWFLWRVLPIVKASGTVAYHYTIYFGIDDLRVWGWVFFLPSVWIAVTCLDLVLAYGTFRRDRIMASSLFAMAALWGIPWLITLFYLAVINASL